MTEAIASRVEAMAFDVFWSREAGASRRDARR